MAAARAKPTRKRNRKRKRRVASDSSSSSDDDSSSSGDSVDRKPSTSPAKAPSAIPSDDSESASSSSSSSSSSEDSSGSEDDPIPKAKSPSAVKEEHPHLASSQRDGQTRDSPSPPSADIRPFIPTDSVESEQVLKEKFRKFWMASLAEGFKDDLEEIRKESNLGPSRLALLVESLASGADVFSSNSTDRGVNEMEVVLDEIL